MADPQIMGERPPPSPCVSVCALDEMDICIGCHRSVDEIAAWLQFSAVQKWQVIQLSQARVRAAGGWLIPPDGAEP